MWFETVLGDSYARVILRYNGYFKKFAIHAPQTLVQKYIIHAPQTLVQKYINAVPPVYMRRMELDTMH